MSKRLNATAIKAKVLHTIRVQNNSKIESVGPVLNAIIEVLVDELNEALTDDETTAVEHECKGQLDLPGITP